ncbi:MAG: hypothetical protein V3T57_09965 [Kiloniellales bacterium]
MGAAIQSVIEEPEQVPAYHLYGRVVSVPDRIFGAGGFGHGLSAGAEAPVRAQATERDEDHQP